MGKEVIMRERVAGRQGRGRGRGRGGKYGKGRNGRDIGGLGYRGKNGMVRGKERK